MRHQSGSGRRRGSFASASVVALALAGLAGTASYAAAPGQPAASSPRTSAPRAATPSHVGGFYDVRTTAARTQQGLLRTAKEPALKQRANAPQARTFSLAPADQTLTDIDPNTGTVRMRVNLAGFLTAASKKSPQTIALGYVRAHHAELGLTLSDVKTFRLARNYKDIAGQHHLYFTQKMKQRHVLGDGLTATVNKAGHLVTLGGSPTSRSRLNKIASVTSTAALATPAQALDEAQDEVQSDPTTTPATEVAPESQDSVSRGLFVVGDTAHQAYQAIVMSSAHPAMVVLDANTGTVLQRRPLTNYENSTGRAYRFFPGSHKGGKQISVNFTKRHWLSGSAKTLSGNNSHTYSDVNDNNRPSKTEEVPPLHGHSWAYHLKPFKLPFAKSFCGNPWPCSWNPNQANSWKVNRAQNATQVFYFVNNWHDHLLKSPIGFTEAAGNFQKVNHTKQGVAGDAVNTQTDDGANTHNGLPDRFHVDNANMTTPPDGHSPVMQMYLQHLPHTPYSNQGDPFSPTNVGDEADTVYHEYTHGLSNRLNVDVQRHSTLGGIQAGAMGEAWSDWYAMDYLVDQGLERDRPGQADVRLFEYDGKGVDFDRTEPIDCKVGQLVPICNGGNTGHGGGYTYADYGKVVGFPEVHGDGEIWAQTLWSLRAALGSKRTESIVTRAMEMAPYNPSFLDMRNAIIAADNSLYAGHDRAHIWSVFASRGMGYFAGSFGGNDKKPAFSTAVPPTSPDLETLQGVVRNAAHHPVKGMTVRLAFQGSGTANPTAVTDKNGHYTLTNVPAGQYQKLQVAGRGYRTERSTVTVNPGGTTLNVTVTH